MIVLERNVNTFVGFTVTYFNFQQSNLILKKTLVDQT